MSFNFSSIIHSCWVIHLAHLIHFTDLWDVRIALHLKMSDPLGVLLRLSPILNDTQRALLALLMFTGLFFRKKMVHRGNSEIVIKP